MIRANTVQTNINGAPISLNDELTLLGSTEKSAVILEAEIDIDQLRTREQLHDHPAGDDWRDTELHESPSVRREDGSEPV